jgi:hypothetical protein
MQHDILGVARVLASLQHVWPGQDNLTFMMGHSGSHAILIIIVRPNMKGLHDDRIGIYEKCPNPVEIVSILAEQQQRCLNCNGDADFFGNRQSLAAFEPSLSGDNPRCANQALLLSGAEQRIDGDVPLDDLSPPIRERLGQQVLAAAIAEEAEHAGSEW